MAVTMSQAGVLHAGKPMWQIPWQLLQRVLGRRWRATYIHVEGHELDLCTGAVSSKDLLPVHIPWLSRDRPTAFLSFGMVL